MFGPKQVNIIAMYLKKSKRGLLFFNNNKDNEKKQGFTSTKGFNLKIV